MKQVDSDMIYSECSQSLSDTLAWYNKIYERCIRCGDPVTVPRDILLESIKNYAKAYHYAMKERE